MCVRVVVYASKILPATLSLTCLEMKRKSSPKGRLPRRRRRRRRRRAARLVVILFCSPSHHTTITFSLLWVRVVPRGWKEEEGRKKTKRNKKGRRDLGDESS